VLTAVGMRQEDLPKVMVRKSDRTVLEVYIDTQLLEPKMQTTIVGEGESQWMIVIIIIEYSGTEK
jgi:hypothetical protein